MDSTLIAVASHKGVQLEPLDPPYKEIYRIGPDDEIFENSVKSLDEITNPTVCWSEYAQFFFSFPLPLHIKTFGFFHYRCFLALDPAIPFAVIDEDNKGYKLPFSERKHFAQDQTKFLDLYKNKFVVAQELKFSCSLWEHFNRNHYGLEETLHKACKKFDECLYVSYPYAEDTLKTTSGLFSRNIFIAPWHVAENWNRIAWEIVKYLDTIKPENPQERWGGFILERLFSTYVTYHLKLDSTFFVQRPLVFFQ